MNTRTTWLLVGLAGLALATVAAAPPKLPEAIEAQRARVSEAPLDGSVLNDLGNLLVLANDLGEAESTFRRATELDPDGAAPRFNLALVLQRQGKTKAALRELDRVVENHADHAWAHYQRGVNLDTLGRTDQAVEAYAAGFRLDPQLAFAEVNPHVIDNRLMTEALLEAHREDSSTVSAPYTFAQPQEIYRMLQPAEEEMEESSGEQIVEDPAPTGPRGLPTPEKQQGERNANAFPPRSEEPLVLDESALQPGRNVGQATPPSAGYRGGTPTSRRNWPSSMGGRTGGTVGGVRSPNVGREEAAKAAAEARATSTSTGGVRGPAPRSRVRPPTQSTGLRSRPVPRFRPPVTSTGRLENGPPPLPGPGTSTHATPAP